MDRVSHPYNVPKCVLGRSSYLHTDMTAHGSYSDPDGGGKNISVGDNVYLKWNKCKMEQQLPLNSPWKERKSMILDNLDKFRAGLLVSKGVLQRFNATRLGHQAITHHLEGRNSYIRLTIAPILFNHHPLCQHSFLGCLVQRYSLEGWTCELWTHLLLSMCNKCFHCSPRCVAFTRVWEIQYCQRVWG